MDSIKNFINEREKLNEQTLDFAGKNIKRFFNLDWNCYKDGALDKKTKELLGLSASMVLRCDDCIKYHLLEAYKAGVNDSEIEEVFSIALIVGGSIVIPHLRRAVAFWEEIKEYNQGDNKMSVFDDLEKEITIIIDSKKTLNEKMQLICQRLFDEIDYYDWVGFYLVKEKKDTLFLGPYVGDETEHVEIPFGKGICGQTAVTNQTFLVPDVTMQSNYLACSMKTKAEIVIPVTDKDGNFIAELDIDSHKINPFTKKDQNFLENICNKLSKYF